MKTIIRETIYRGKPIGNETTFVYGDYTEGSPGYHYITTPEGRVTEVHVETVALYIGIKDAAANFIYEGSKVKKVIGNRTIIGRVEYCAPLGQYIIRDERNFKLYYPLCSPPLPMDTDDCVFDNLEVIE